MIIPNITAYAATALIAAVLASGAIWRVQDWRWTAKVNADALERNEAARIADEARHTDAKQQRQFADIAAGSHAATVAALATQLGDARARIATLSDTRQCFDGGTVRMLNSLGAAPGGVGLRAAAGEPAGAPQAAPATQADHAAAAADPSYASERDTAEWIAICRTQHDELASQVNQILDIEDRRQRTAAEGP
jgi:hypothetical protein